MIDKSEWQKANRELMAEERRKLGDPPTAEEMLAYSRGELSEAEDERIQDLLVAYPELARMFAEPFPEEGDPVPQEQLRAGWSALQRRLGGSEPLLHPRAETQRGRWLLHRHVPMTIAAALAVIFFGLFVQAESRARHHARRADQPRILAAPQELDPDGTRGADKTPTMLHKEGDAYLLKPRLINRVRHPHYQLELRDANDTPIWTNNTAQPDEDDTFQIEIPHPFLRAGEPYALRIVGVNGDTRALVALYDLAVPAE
jgi:hypothetical protein